MEAFDSYVDQRGKLVPITLAELPFQPKRLFYVTEVPPGTVRGGHAHFNNQQILICLSGRIRVILEKTDSTIEEFVLLPDQHCFVDKLVWDSQEFIEPNTTLLVVCSIEYDKSDYITDKSLFLTLKTDKNG